MSAVTFADDARVHPDFNIFRTASFAAGHPWAVYDEMRGRGALVRHPGEGDFGDLWVATSHEAVRAVSHDTENFSSSAGFNLPAGARRVPSQVTAALGRNILNYDPPDHAEFKRLLMPAFTPARIAALEQSTRAFVGDLLAGLEGRSEIEFVREVASIIPIRVLCQLLGIPKEDEPKILAWTNKMVGSTHPEFAPDPSVTFAAFMEVFAYGKWLIEKRRAEPQDDLMSMVAHGALNGAPLDENTRNGMCATLIGAGNETTRNAISSAIHLLSGAPDQRRRLAADGDLTGNAIEELLRRTTPVIHVIRLAKRDVVVAGQRIAKGELVALLYGSANHDETVFDNPYALDLTRSTARRHVAFGTGIHLCIGQRVAQIEMRVLIPELLRRYPDIEAISEPEIMLSNFVYGIKRMNVRLG